MPRSSFIPRVLAALVSLAPLPLSAQGPVIGQGVPIRADDLARLDALDQAAGAALRQALAEGTPAEIAQATAALRGPALAVGAVDLAALAGEWNCRMIKLGGISPIVTYPAFRCRITATSGAARFEKLTGSQRTRGQLHPDGDRLVYLGSTFVAGEQPRDYGDFPPEIDLAGSETLPDAGLVEVTGHDSLRLLFPQPYRESLLNVMVLTR